MTPFDEGEPPWWRPAVRESLGDRPVHPPLWPPVAQLSPLALGDRRLDERQVGELLMAVRKSTAAAPLPLVREAKRHFDPAALDAFVWRLFELCLAKAEAPEIKWALAAVGLLGGDASALKLAPLVRDWPGAGFSQRAALGLESLRAIGSETALMQLHGIAQKVKFKALQAKARKFMDEIATQRGLTPQQLEDRIVPDLGLDERGSRVFDYGPRQFRLVFGPNLKPLLRDEQGKAKGTLPKAGAKDDPAKVEVAARDWKLLKKQVSETVKAQAGRLERAMVTRRRWPVADFEKYVVGHPFLCHMARTLLWGEYEPDGRLVAAFRITEDRTCADSDDRARELGKNLIGIVHPLQLTDAERARWGEVFADYEIIPPFPQLGRRVHTLQSGEEDQTELTRFRGPTVPEIAFAGILKKLGWLARSWEGGHGYCKPFPEAGVTALIQEEYAAGGLTITRAFFAGDFLPSGRADRPQALRLGDVDPVVLSEVLGVLTVLMKRGQ